MYLWLAIMFCFLFSSATAMNLDDQTSDFELDFFEIENNNLHVRLKKINMLNLGFEDRQTLIQATKDGYDVFRQFSFTNLLFSMVLTIAPNWCLDEHYIKVLSKKVDDMPSEHKVCNHWLILSPNNDFIGAFGVTTYVANRPDQYTNDFLLEIGLTIHPDFRNQKITSTFARLIIEKIYTDEQFKDAIICFKTEPTNTRMIHVAEKIGAQHVYTCNDGKLFYIVEK